jgi:hypothetical protein
MTVSCLHCPFNVLSATFSSSGYLSVYFENTDLLRNDCLTFILNLTGDFVIIYLACCMKQNIKSPHVSSFGRKYLHK